MTTICYTCVTPGPWRELAELSSERMEWATGLPARVLEAESAFPCWDRYDFWHLPASEGVDAALYFDADIWALREFDVRKWATYQIGVVLEPETPVVRSVMRSEGLTWYANAGLVWMQRSAAKLYERMCVAYDRSIPRLWHDQTPFNIELRNGWVRPTILGEEYNRILNPVRDHPIETAHERHAGAVCLHYTAMPVERRLAIFKKLSQGWSE